MTANYVQIGFARMSDIERLKTDGDGTVFYISDIKPFSDWTAIYIMESSSDES